MTSSFAGEDARSPSGGAGAGLTWAELDGISVDVSTQAVLTAKQAAWLNGLGDYEMVKERVSKLTADRLEKSHLLNLDIREDVAYHGYSFTVEDIAVDDENITVKVKLTARPGSSGR